MDEYREFLEKVCTFVAKVKPESIAFASINPDGTTMCAYFHAGPPEKSLMASVIQQDAIMERIENNPAWLRECLDKEEENENG